MNLLNQLVPVFKNLQNLGRTRLMMLAGVGVVSIAVVLCRGALRQQARSGDPLCRARERGSEPDQHRACRSQYRLSRSEPTEPASTVPAGMTGKARLLLAERGLPNSANAGYELFDNVGSLGLTSFMQEVTRVRALEGEIGRTIHRSTASPRPASTSSCRTSATSAKPNRSRRPRS